MQGGPLPEHLTFLLWHSRHLVRDLESVFEDGWHFQSDSVSDATTYAIGRREGVADICC